MDIEKSVIIVTGASGSLGSLIAKEVAKYGAKVVLQCHESVETAKQTVLSISQAEREAFFFQADLTNMDQLHTLFDVSVDRFHHVDAIINCASLFIRSLIGNVDEKRWDEDQAIHQKAPFFLSQLLYSHAHRRNACACVVNITDAGIYHPTKGYPSYWCAKRALKTQTEVLAATMGPYLRVNSVAPGPIIAKSQQEALYFSKLEKQLPLRRLPKVEQVIEAVLFLLRNDSVTGVSIAVDGGAHLRYIQ